MPQVLDPLDRLDPVLGQVQVPEVRAVLHALHCLHAILLKEQAPQLRAMLQT